MGTRPNSDLGPLIEGWPVPRAAIGVTSPTGTLAVGGDSHWVTRVASVSKLLVGLAGLVALEEGSIDLDEPAGPPGSTARHLLAHASGLAFDEHRVIAASGSRRIYSNAGIEQFCDHLAARTGIPFAEYLTEAVTSPLGMSDTALIGSPAHGVHSSVADLLCLARELLFPHLIHRSTLVDARTVQFPGLGGVLPGIGRFEPNPWGLTFELRKHKSPHWTGHLNSPQTFGHFGGSGAFCWVDPHNGLGCVALTDRPFDDWALTSWPATSDAIVERFAAGLSA